MHLTPVIWNLQVTFNIAAMGRTGAALVLAAAVIGCGGPPPGEEAVNRPSFERFELEVQPILELGCANPSCHGRPERPLSIYAPLRHRADPSRTHLAEPLTADELLQNYSVSRVLGSGGASADETLLVRKPLAEHAATYHGGGAVFDGAADERHRTLRAWVAEGFAP